MNIEISQVELDLIFKLVSTNAKMARQLIDRRDFDSHGYTFKNLTVRAELSENLIASIERQITGADKPKQTQVTDESYALVKLYKGNPSDEQITADFPDREGYGTGSPYDCSTRWFCNAARVVRNSYRTLVVQRYYLDI